MLTFSALCLVSANSIQAKGGVKPPPPPPAPPAVPIPLEATLLPATAFGACGEKAAVSGNTAVFICADQVDALTIKRVTYIYQRVGTVWTKQAKLTDINAGENINSSMGGALVINGNTIAFSVFTNNVVSPYAVYVYQRSTSATGVVTWSRQARIAAPSANENFATSSTGFSNATNGALALQGDTLVVGAPGADTAAGVDAGAAYVYKRALNVWSLSAKLSPSAANDQFGNSVALSNGTLVVGARGTYNITTGRYTTAVYVFQNPTGTATWNQQTKISTPAGASWGPSLDIDGDTLLVGISSAPAFSAAAYVYQRSGTLWSLQATLKPLGLYLDNQAGFGTTTTLKGNVAVIGAPALNDVTGRIFIYSRAGTVWTQKATLGDPNIEELSGYGYSLDLDGNTLIVGSPRGYPLTRGSTLVYRLPAL